jgi:mRNA-degrading endonuclease RelE of RelBE toxin-antitoxin system
MEIEYTDEALGNLLEIPRHHADQITRKIERLRMGLVGDIRGLTNAEAGYRLRSGDYRVLFDCDGKSVVVRKIKNRRDAYR